MALAMAMAMAGALARVMGRVLALGLGLAMALALALALAMALAMVRGMAMVMELVRGMARARALVLTLKPIQKDIVEMLEAMLSYAKNGSLQNIIAVYDCDKEIRWAESIKGLAIPAFVGGIEAVKHSCLTRILEAEYNDYT